jgi:hypothetical protein
MGRPFHDLDTQPGDAKGVPEPVVDTSELLTRPVYSDLLREVSEDTEKLEKVRLLVSQAGDLTHEELRTEMGKLYGRNLAMHEVLSLLEMLSS